MTDLIEYILDLIFKNGIGLEIAPLPDSFKSKFLPEYRLIIINKKLQSSPTFPFILGHELGHYFSGNDGAVFYYASSTGNIKVEHAADMYSLNLIFKYAIKNRQCFDEPIDFLNAYGIPKRMLPYATQLFEQDTDIFW